LFGLFLLRKLLESCQEMADVLVRIACGNRFIAVVNRSGIAGGPNS
jgi:hypothetical protein